MDIRAFELLALKRSFGKPMTMASRLVLRIALAAACSLLAGLAGCRDAIPPGKTAAIKPDKSRAAFFERPAALATARASSTPSPLIVLLSTDPWKMVVGSDSPTFALYSDGTVLFRRKDDYGAVKLNRTELNALIEGFSSPELVALSGHYEAANWTDQPGNNLLLYGRKVPLYITVYGYLNDVQVRAKLPDTVLEAFDRLRNFSAPSAKPWLPREVEVMVWPYEHAPDSSIIWPKRWPALASPATRKRGDSYSIFIPSSELPALRSFLAARREKGAVEIDGKKWSASIRLPFPHEELWMAPNDEIATKQ